MNEKKNVGNDKKKKEMDEKNLDEEKNNLTEGCMKKNGSKTRVDKKKNERNEE